MAGISVIVELAFKILIYPAMVHVKLFAKTFCSIRYAGDYWLQEREPHFQEHGTTTGFNHTRVKYKATSIRILSKFPLNN